jgi:peptidase M50-like protein
VISFLILVLLLGVTLSALFTLGQVLALRAFGVRPAEVGLGTGPALTSFRVGLTRVVIKLLPTGTYMGVAPPDLDDPSETPGPELVSNLEAYERLGLARQGLVDFAGVVLLALLAIVLLGPAFGVESILAGVLQLLEGAMSPRTRGAGLIKSCFQLFEARGALVLAGVIAAKLAAMNLLPIASSSLGRQLLNLIAPPRHPIRPARIYATYAMGLASLILGVCWLVAAVSAA